MPVTSEQARALGRRLLAARTRLLSEHGFYGLLLMHMKFAVGDELDTAWVTHDTITFNPDFAAQLNADELGFVLQHEVLHAALGHLLRVGERNRFLFNLAADIVVNSNIKHENGDDPMSITLRCMEGEPFHLTPAGKEGWHYSVEEVYEMLVRELKRNKLHIVYGKPRRGKGVRMPGASSLDQAIEEARDLGRGGRWDWHVCVDVSADEEAEIRAEWDRRLAEARESMRARDPLNQRGLVPACAERHLDELGRAQADWRILLNDFVQEEVCDYSFTSPDRRFYDSPFVLPSFSDTDAVVRNVLFMVDTSGSVSDKDLTAAFSEIAGALAQFGGKLEGWVGFFDAVPYEPTKFGSVEELLAARPCGGGGTRFEAPFECVDRWLDGESLACIVILTDGWAPYPSEAKAHGIPVLWLLTGDGPKSPWGRVVRISHSG